MRPRLVEEGKPITTDNIDHQDEFEYHNQHMSIVDRTSSNISNSTSTSISSNTNGHNSKKYTSSLSSLARKTRTNNVTPGANTNGNTKGNTNSKIQTSIEIGPSKSSKQSNNGNIISSSLNQYQYPRQRQHQLQHQQGHDDIQIDEYAYASDRHFSSVSMAAQHQHQHQHEHKKKHQKGNKIRTSFEIGGGGGGQHQMDDHLHHTSNNLPIHYNNMDIDQEKNSMEVDDANVNGNTNANGTTNFNEIQKTYESIGTANSIQVPNNYYSYHEDQQNQYQQQQQYHLQQQQHHTTQSFMNEKIETQTQIPSSLSFTPSRMEIDDTLPKSPLVVIDGPNVAYAYAEALNSSTNSSLSTANNKSSKNSIEPDVRGIEIAASYFINAGCRAQIVIPTYWLRRKPQNGTSNRTNGDNALMLTEQVEILQKLKSQNLLLCSPPTDDDDAYAIAVARREDSRSQSRRIQSPQVRTLQTDAGGGADSMSCDVLSVCGAFVLSNDLFRDASQRDGSGELHNWLRGKGGSSGSESTLPGRISYSFCDIGCMDLDFVANPRHLLVEIIERYNQKHSISYTSF